MTTGLRRLEYGGRAERTGGAPGDDGAGPGGFREMPEMEPGGKPNAEL
jgi:hypothetical protein